MTIRILASALLLYIVKGNAKTAGGEKFILKADDSKTPMPKGSEGDTKTIDIKDEGSYSFGDMTFTTPGEYWYTVTRDTIKKKGVKKDDSVFRVKIIALNDGHGYLLAYKEKSDDKDDLVYTDQVSPKTGEDNMIIYCGMAFGAAAIVLLFITLKKRDKDKQE